MVSKVSKVSRVSRVSIVSYIVFDRKNNLPTYHSYPTYCGSLLTLKKFLEAKG